MATFGPDKIGVRNGEGGFCAIQFGERCRNGRLVSLLINDKQRIALAYIGSLGEESLCHHAIYV